MLSKSSRVKKNTFITIMEKGSTTSSPFFVLRYLNQRNPQYAFVVPKKLEKKAAKRNSLKRKGYNILRKYNIKSNAGIFFYKKEGIKANILDINKEIEFLLNKIKSI